MKLKASVLNFTVRINETRERKRKKVLRDVQKKKGVYSHRISNLGSSSQDNVRNLALESHRATHLVVSAIKGPFEFLANWRLVAVYEIRCRVS